MAIVKSPAQSYALARLLHRGPIRFDSGHPVRADVQRALTSRGWAEVVPIDPTGPQWQTQLRLTDVGRAVAESSRSVREWVEGPDA